jgi:hypothetical protein
MTFPTVVVNGKPIGSLKNAGFLTAVVPADELSTFGFSSNIIIWPYPSWTHEFRAYPGQIAYVRLDLFIEGLDVVYRAVGVEESQAIDEMKDLLSSAHRD